MTAERPPIVLCISGLDPSGGAGFALDIRVASSLGAATCGVVTALTVQDTSGARRCEPVDHELAGEQLAAILGDVEIAAVKIGLVPNRQLAQVIAGCLAATAAPIVWDPVFAATRGATLLYDDPREIAAALAPECTLVTPNLGEAAVLGSDPEAIRDQFGCDVLLTGGHAEGDEAIDVLFAGGDPERFTGPKHAGPAPRGTGCYLSTAIATHLSFGTTMKGAVSAAKKATTDAIAGATAFGRGAPLLW